MSSWELQDGQNVVVGRQNTAPCPKDNGTTIGTAQEFTVLCNTRLAGDVLCPDVPRLSGAMRRNVWLRSNLLRPQPGPRVQELLPQDGRHQFRCRGRGPTYRFRHARDGCRTGATG
ncbi:hypothetical protein L209DRAFT_677702 [Thermothelomyces heterothallicus CBS 203.75]